MLKSGYSRIFITACLLLCVQHAEFKCMEQNMNQSFYPHVLEDHFFEIKNFNFEQDEMKQNLLSLTNTLCLNWKKNREQDTEYNCHKKVIECFEIMLYDLFNITSKETSAYQEEISRTCESLTCNDDYVLSYVNKSTFGNLYKKSCHGSILDLKCPNRGNVTNPSTTEKIFTQDTHTNIYMWAFTGSMLLNLFCVLFCIRMLLKKRSCHCNEENTTSAEEETTLRQRAS